MTSSNDTYAKGLALEQSNKLELALALWIAGARTYPTEARFHIKGAGVALKLKDFAAADHFLTLGAAAAMPGAQREAVRTLKDRKQKLVASVARVEGRAAFDTQNYALAAQHFSTLLEADPDHPWAAAYLRKATGLSADFAERLARELPDVSKRVLITGCGRSGTWMIAAMFASGIEGITVAPGEQHFGTFLFLPNEPKIHLVKRQHDTYLDYAHIPDEIFVVNVLRHPFDVLTSTHLGKKNYITIKRYEDEMLAYEAHLKSRPRTLNVRYEDVLRAPATFQQQVEGLIGTKAARPFDEFYKDIDLPVDVVEAMHGLRPIDVSTIDRWRRQPEAWPHLKEQMALSDGTLARVTADLEYSIDIG